MRGTKWFSANIGVILLVCSAAARADLGTAVRAYDKKDFSTAFAEFQALAELGQPDAQLNLAIMYARGEGTPISMTNAHAWASLAATNGQKRAASLVAQVAPELTPTSLKLSAEIQADYSPAKLNASLMPVLLDNREYADRDPVRRIKAFVPSYPPEAQNRGVQGQVYVEFKVAPDGRARMPRILMSVPQGTFDEAVRQSVFRTTFLPGRINGRPVATDTATFFTFRVVKTSSDDYPDLMRFAKATRKKAEEGDIGAQTLYGMMLAGLPQFEKPFSEALPWFLKAAQGGSPYSQYQPGTALLHGRGCLCEETKGEIWLEKAAQADQADAQVTLAEYLLKGSPSGKSVSSAKVWLERAARSGNPTAKLYLAAVLSTNGPSSVRDPSTALSLINDAMPTMKDDPTSFEVRAAALAATGDFAAAVRDEKRAVDIATLYGWDLGPLNERLTSYLAQKPWEGNLLML